MGLQRLPPGIGPHFQQGRIRGLLAQVAQGLQPHLPFRGDRFQVSGLGRRLGPLALIFLLPGLEELDLARRQVHGLRFPVVGRGNIGPHLVQRARRQGPLDRAPRRHGLLAENVVNEGLVDGRDVIARQFHQRLPPHRALRHPGGHLGPVGGGADLVLQLPVLRVHLLPVSQLGRGLHRVVVGKGDGQGDTSALVCLAGRLSSFPANLGGVDVIGHQTQLGFRPFAGFVDAEDLPARVGLVSANPAGLG